MESYQTLLFLGLILLTSSIYQINYKDEQNDFQAFKTWAQQHKKNYKSQEELMYRYSVFFKNKNQLQSLQSASYAVGLNKFSDLTFEEFAQTYLISIPQQVSQNYVELPINNSALEINWVKKGAVTKVVDQGKCGSCWAFSAAASLEGLWQTQKGQLIELSKQQLMDCSGSYGNRGCSGGWMDWAFDYIWDEKIMTEESYPYGGYSGSCNYDWNKGVFSIKGYKYVKHNDEEQLEAALNIQPISVGIAADQGLVHYTGGIYDGSCADQTNHGVLAVGYGEENGQKYWLVKNSWGSDWGENGFFRFVKQVGKVGGQCYIANQPVYPHL